MTTMTSGGNSAFPNYNINFAHMEDPNERRRLALAQIDNAPFGWRHARAVVVAGVGFFTDSYDIFAINLCSAMLAIKVSTSGSTVTGQLFFGGLADIVGRKRMYGVELIIIILATLAQALASNSPAVSITSILVFWRVLMRIGIGGDYPLSSIITSEFATTRHRGAMMDFGAAIVALIVTVGFKGSIESAASVAKCSGVCQLAVDKMWRVVIGFGAVPACLALYYRLTIPETPRYTFDVARDIEKAGADVRAYIEGKHEGHPNEVRRVAVLQDESVVLVTPKAGWSDFWSHFLKWKNGKVLLGTAGSWFFLDVGAFYALGFNNSIILTAIGWNGGENVYEYFYRNAVGNLILICAGAISGYWVGVATVDYLGGKPIQLMGFIVLTIVFIVIGFAYEPPKRSNNGLLALYVIAQFFFNFGPNATTFIVPGECKVGAIIAQCVFGPLAHKGAKEGKNSSDTPWLNHVMQTFALFMLCGSFTSLLITETKGKTLELMSGDEPPVPSSESTRESQSQVEARPAWPKNENPISEVNQPAA
ncbi:phosphate permease [Aspergillus minisclerotigenes]|uniref:Phosphate permease n=1 Tax=Aspergillus minisclerotigenes TaxID=656917 RepID=A0A5N6JK10_9EURO|nr:phosphate permease [Aspergillus minisclerotigenes]